MKPNQLYRRITLMASWAVTLFAQPARASVAYGSINNFDTVNDTGSECHGFEIELEDCHSTDISYTYNYNHYGAPNITEDNSVAGHPKCVIRWESKKNPDGSWAAFTAIPAGPIAATNGHMFTNPSVNFGGEHFGVGYQVQPTAIRYNWLVDQGGALVHGGAVQVSTPTFTYYPPAGGAPAVQAVIAPPPPPAPEPKEFGKAVWVKEIRTTSHNNKEVRLRDLVSDDPEDLNDKNWRNGEPDEVESEWQILQKDYHKADAPNNELAAAAEELPNADEVVTRRYEFYKYTGPLDIETGEAMAESVDADGIHGTGVKLINGVEVDLSNVEIVGEFTGSQMAAVDVDAPVGLIDHVGEGEVNTPFAARTVVVEGALPFTSSVAGALPAGMDFDDVSGVLSGTPTESGEFIFKITADDGVNPEVAKNYTLRIAAEGEALPPESLVDTAVSPPASGTTTGDGAYAPGTEVTVTAAAGGVYHFVSWTDNGKVVGTATSHTFTLDVNHSLIANFSDLPQWNITTGAEPVIGGGTSGGGLLDDGSGATVVAAPNAGYSFVNWTENGNQVSTSASYAFIASSNRSLVANFIVTPTYAVGVSAIPVAGGTASGGGNFPSGASVTVEAAAVPGYVFAGWKSGASLVSSSPDYTFTVTTNKTLVANFVVAGIAKTVTTSANPVVGGMVSGNGTYVTGVIATVVATPKPGYTFSKWQEGNSTVSTSPSYGFTVTANRTLVAKFNEFFVVTTSSAPEIGGTTEADSLSYKTGENARVKAFPETGWSFASWTENGTVVSTDSTYDFNITGNRTLVAHFTWDAGVTITTASSTAIGGTTSGDGPYSNGDDVDVLAIPEDGYAFLNWTEDGVEVSADEDYVFPASVNRSLVANFTPYLNIVATASPAEAGFVDGGGLFIAGDTTYLSADPVPGYVFTGWTENGVSVSPSNSFDITVTAARELVANFVIADVPTPISITPAPTPGTAFSMEWSMVPAGWTLEESPSMAPGTWSDSIRPDTPHDGLHHVEVVEPAPQNLFFRLKKP